MQHIREVIEMVLQELVEDQEPVPDDSLGEVAVSSSHQVAITI